MDVELLPALHCAPVLASHGVRLCCTYGQTELAGPVLFGKPGGDAELLRPLARAGAPVARPAVCR